MDLLQHGSCCSNLVVIDKLQHAACTSASGRRLPIPPKIAILQGVQVVQGMIGMLATQPH